MPIYDYPATLVRVLDGDTVVLNVTRSLDFGFHVTSMFSAEQRFRLARVNTPERNQVGNVEATAFTAEWLRDHAEHLRVTSLKPDKYGDRWNGEVYDGTTGENLSTALLASGLASKYPKEKP